jgi:hypothetical protein
MGGVTPSSSNPVEVARAPIAQRPAPGRQDVTPAAETGETPSGLPPEEPEETPLGVPAESDQDADEGSGAESMPGIPTEGDPPAVG